MKPNYRSALLGLLLLAICPLTSEAEPIRSTLKDYFSSKKGHRPTDLISRTDFDRFMGLLNKSGQDTSGFAPLRERIPADSSYLQRLSRTAKGKRFLRKTAATKGGYASIEKLAETTGGEKALRQIISAKGGEDMIRYMATTTGGKKMLKKAPGGKKHGASQAKAIYTAEQLLKAMQETAARGRSMPRKTQS